MGADVGVITWLLRAQREPALPNQSRTYQNN
jgi:hypothetical protein